MVMSAKGDSGGIRIRVKVIPRARTNQISGFMEDGSLKVRLTAPPVDGKANQALIDLLADTLDLPKSNISILSGSHSRNKTVGIVGISLEGYQKVIDQLTA